MDELHTFLELGYWTKLLQKIIERTLHILPSILFLIIFLIVSLKLYRFLIKRLNKFILYRTLKHTDKDEDEAKKRINTLIGILLGLGRVIIWGTFVIMLLKKFGIDVAPILAGAGVVGLAVGFGSQELVRDFISGFFILLENQLRTGDVAIINGTAGAVEKMELRTITLRDYSGVVHVFQTGKINSLSNMTKEWSAAVFEVGVAYKENTDQVIDTMLDVASKMQLEAPYSEWILEPMEIAGLDRFDNSAVVIKARFKTRPSEQWKVMREYNRRLKQRFDELGIEIPFPQTTIHFAGTTQQLLEHSEKTGKKE